MPLPRFRHRTLIIAVAAALVLGAGLDGSRGEMPPRAARRGLPPSPTVRPSLAAAFTNFGLVFFLFYLSLAILGFRRSASRDDRLEAAGAVIPGLAGLGIVGAVWAGPPWAFALIAASVPFMTVGRAVYELIVFRPRPPCDSPGSRRGG